MLDSCVWGPAALELRAAGCDDVWTGDWPADPGDLQILQWAHQEHRILVTLDKDFGELAIVRREPHGGIIRLVGVSARRHASLVLHVLERFAAELEAGALVTVEPGRVRIRPADRCDDPANE